MNAWAGAVLVPRLLLAYVSVGLQLYLVLEVLCVIALPGPRSGFPSAFGSSVLSLLSAY